jgi:Tfp pilus assembly protein PilO
MSISNPFQMVVAIIFIVSVASVLRAKIGYHRDALGPRRHRRDRYEALPNAENEALRAEVRALKDRVAVLERLATDSHSALEREFDKLRQQD